MPIRIATLAFARCSVRNGPESCLRHWCSSRYQRISPLHREFHSPLPSSSFAVSSAVPWLSQGISRPTCRAACEPFTPSDTGQRLHPTCESRLLTRSLSVLLLMGYVPTRKSFTTLVVEDQGRPRSRGVAASGLPPLRKIPHCCHLPPMSART